MANNKISQVALLSSGFEYHLEPLLSRITITALKVSRLHS